jgi:hypothetical protein
MINDWKLKIESKETNASVKNPVEVVLRECETQSVTLLMVKKIPFFLGGLVVYGLAPSTSPFAWLIWANFSLPNNTERGKRSNER